MGSVERTQDAAARRGLALLGTLCDELRNARLERGVSQAVLARAVGISQSRVSRIERHRVIAVSVPELCRLLAAVGLVLSARTFPDGTPIRDAAHRALLDRLRGVLAPSVRLRFEVPLPIPGDLRAWDVVQLDRVLVGVEAETAPRDVQALQRRVALKLRDDPRVGGVVIVLADTRRNRRLMREHGDAFRADWPTGETAMLQALRAGRDPAGSGVLLL